MRRALVSAAAVFLTLSTTRADVVVTLNDGTVAPPGNAEVLPNPLGPGWNVTLTELYNPGGETIYVITGTGGVIISNIIIDVPCWMNLQGQCAPAGSPLIVSVLNGDAAGIQTIGRIEQTGAAETLLLWAEATGDIGLVMVEDISQVHAGRDVIGPVISTTENNSVRGVFIVSAGRNVLGDVTAVNGRVGAVRAQGTIGLPGAPVALQSRYFFFEISSPTGIYAHVNTRMNGGTTGLWAMLAPVFEGTIETANLLANPFNPSPSRIVIPGRFRGDLIVGRSFNSAEGYIELPKDGFEGQIVFNADLAPGAEWVNPVYFGVETDPERTVIIGPGYALPAADLGGGSIGLVPFRLHGESCVPANGTAIAMPEDDSPVIARARHYGPIIWTAGAPVTIERRALGSIGPFTPLSSLDFGIEIDPLDANTLLIGPTDAGQGGLVAGFEYRVGPTPELRCDVSGQPSVVWDEPYFFAVNEFVCPGDVDADRTIGIQDFLFLLASWGPTSIVSEPLDTDQSGSIGIVDFLFLLAHWGPC